MQNRSSNDTNRALNNGVKKDIVQFHPLVSIIYLHIISRSRSIKGWSNHYHHYQYYTPLNQLYRRIATYIVSTMYIEEDELYMVQHLELSSDPNIRISSYVRVLFTSETCLLTNVRKTLVFRKNEKQDYKDLLIHWAWSVTREV